MIFTILRKELVEVARDRRFVGLCAVLFVLSLAASIDGWNRIQADSAAREQAVQADREIWHNQGDNNPHGAAHFARYAFRALPVLAAFDPGVFDHAGAAFWMEAHTQNPTTLRRAEDVAVSVPFASLSPAWIIQVIATLAIAVLMFPAVAGEREQGTLRALSGTGVSARLFAVGKAGAALVVVAALCGLSFITALAPAVAQGGFELPPARLGLMLLGYTLALVAFAQMMLLLSALCASLAQAFASAALVWFVLALAWPALASQLALTVYPDEDEQALKNAIQLQANTPFWAGDAKEPAVAALEAKVLADYGAETFDELGFDREALVLQAHEEFANTVYDRLYGELEATHAAQDTVLRYASLLSPVLALQRLSAGLAGTDLLAQQRFADQAEQHRRKIIEALNRDMMENAGDAGFRYAADRRLWERTPDFVPQPPSLAEVMRHYSLEWMVVLLWLLAASRLALRASARALGQEVL